MHKTLHSSQVAHVTHCVRSVIYHEDDQCVLDQVEFVEFLQQATDVLVDVCNHRRNARQPVDLRRASFPLQISNDQTSKVFRQVVFPEIFRNIKPEESMGFVSVAEVIAAGDNVNAILQGQQPQSLPQEGQDHMARIEVYKRAAIVAAASGNEQVVQVLQQLIELQAQVLEQEQSKTAEPGRRVQ